MQTAVEWLDRWFRDNPEATHEEGNKALQQALQMEKQQIMDALTYGNKMELMASQKMFAEQYYTSTYGSKGSDETNGNNVEKVPNVTSSQTEISDEEIEEAAKNAWSDYVFDEGNLYYTTFKGGWEYGIKWYREQLKKK